MKCPTRLLATEALLRPDINFTGRMRLAALCKVSKEIGADPPQIDVFFSLEEAQAAADAAGQSNRPLAWWKVANQ